MSAALRRLLERVRGTLQSPVVLLVSLAVSSCVSGPIGGIGESPAVSQELPASTRQLIVSVIDERGTPLEGAVVSFTDAGGTHVAVSDPEGLAAFDWIQGPVTVVADAPGLLPGEAVVVERPDDPFSLALHPVVLRGTVTDEGGYPLAGALVTLGASQTTSGPDGGFELLRAAPGPAPSGAGKDRWSS